MEKMPKIKVTLLLLLLTVKPDLLLSIKIHCIYANRIREDHIHYCCKHPDGHNNITEACAKETGFPLPAFDEEAMEDVTVEQVWSKSGSCWAQCVFEKFNFLKKGKLDMDVIRQHYSTFHDFDPEYEREMIEAFDHCHGPSEEATIKYFRNQQKSAGNDDRCDPDSSVILSCVIHYFFHNCPKNRWASTNECQVTLDFARKCKDVLTTM